VELCQPFLPSNRTERPIEEIARVGEDLNGLALTAIESGKCFDARQT
jgi:hypothetical protein